METLKTAGRAMDVLLALAEHGAMSPTEISRTTGLNRTVVHRLLATLHSRGFVRRTGELYRPGAVFVRFAQLVEPELRLAALPVMQPLAAATGETAVLSVPDDSEIVAVEQVVGRAHPVRVEYDLGGRRPLRRGASGRAVLAFLGESAVQAAVAMADDPPLLARQLEEVQRVGYATSHDELRQGVHGIAAPVYGGEGRPLASLSLLAPATRAAELVSHTERVLAAAREISSLITADRAPQAAI